MVARTQPCTPATRAGRNRKARQFREAASVIRELADEAADVADAYVTLLVHAGIAASDVICCARLGEHAQGDNHAEAVALLAAVDADCANALDVLLRLKTRAGYSHQSVSADDIKRAERAARRLTEAMAVTPGT